MKCWSCGRDLEGISTKISFRATCDYCHMALHCCRNCVYYKPGQPNDCLVPNTEFVADRTATNFCEEFKLKNDQGEDLSFKKKNAFDAFNKLFD